MIKKLNIFVCQYAMLNIKRLLNLKDNNYILSFDEKILDEPTQEFLFPESSLMCNDEKLLKYVENYIFKCIESKNEEICNVYTSSQIIFDYLRVLIKKEIIDYNKTQVYFVEAKQKNISDIRVLYIDDDGKLIFPEYEDETKSIIVHCLGIDKSASTLIWPKTLFPITEMLLSNILGWQLK